MEPGTGNIKINLIIKIWYLYTKNHGWNKKYRLNINDWEALIPEKNTIILDKSKLKLKQDGMKLTGKF